MMQDVGNQDLSAWNALGEHRYRTEDDLLRWVNGPEHSAAELVALCVQAHAISMRYGYALIIVDSTRGGHVSAAGRKAVIEYYRTHPLMRSATAVVGASTLTRVTGQLVVRAMALLKIQSANQLLAFLVDEAAANRWLAEQRRLFLGQLKAPG